MNALERVKAAADRCVACAACRTGCPTFDATLEEGRSGRGRTHLVRAALDGLLSPGTDRFEELLSSCTRCGFCAEICPVGIPVVDVIDAGRALTTAARGAPFRTRVVVAALKRPRLLRFVITCLSVWQRLLGRSGAGPEPLPGFGRGKPIFRLRARGARRDDGGPREGKTVALRVGCRTDALTPEAADDAAYLLRRAGLRVVVPKSQGCGGAFATAAGLPEDAAELAEASRRAFDGAAKTVASMCGACDATGSAHGGDDWTRVLEEAGFAPPFDLSRLKGPVVVHDPCSARYGPNGSTAALRILRAAGVDARPLDGVACCGGSAPFALDADRLSANLGGEAGRRARNATGNGTFVTSDAGCLLQFASFGNEATGDGAFHALHLATALRRLVDADR